tara:strand:- start:333 stop:533 length:201 start_codon:yes stop_codon:yes gene_type:complete
MARLKVEATTRYMRRKNILFKHNLAQSAGVDYMVLREIFEEGKEVSDEVARRLCAALECEVEDICR